MSKKQLIELNLSQIDMLVHKDTENERLTKKIIIKNNVIRSKDYRIEDQQRIIIKYRELLETAVENL